MAQLLVRHKVQDYNKWKSQFDEHAATRSSAGCQGGRLFRSSDNPNEVMVLFEWEDRDKASQFVDSDDLRRTMERAGVADKPDVYYLDEVERFSR